MSIETPVEMTMEAPMEAPVEAPVINSNRRDQRNYSISDDKALCHAWEDISMDPIADSRQTTEIYAGKLKDCFDAKVAAAIPEGEEIYERTASALSTRISGIIREVARYSAFYTKEIGKSGMNEALAVSYFIYVYNYSRHMSAHISQYKERDLSPCTMVPTALNLILGTVGRF